ncbi:hypothetical protein CN271_30350 [Bacillus cereus]|uniref:hypothetical protein n=1 Tax=Bacillus cereus TaxID=1396 RepID=UPI000BEC6F55|nr:hypothetical protein [Bacillus cereus]PEE32238.1 hypothetical protein CON59_32320 [Bacillus cereus]PET38835.1 hypothetical protein CN523_25675 [Bacillus cereus]PEV66994.1 hypothetical protein CN429_31710 [Bacillus cereus]PFA37839.1 hypothetical protein CN389_31145 [Bacillus cereus]PFD57499.1 hypothetical protein CN271_30350 [Bacillus cereus]
MGKKSKKEELFQQLFTRKMTTVDATNLPVNLIGSLTDILKELVAAFPPRCLCPPSQQTITQIENALDVLLIWSTFAPISNRLKLDLQNAINAVKNQLDANPFSCCDTIQALEWLETVLSKVIIASQMI